MSKTEVSGKQLKDGSVELVDLASEVSDVLDSKADTSSLATVATSGSYTDLADKPSIPSVDGLASETYVDTAVAAVQADVDAEETRALAAEAVLQGNIDDEETRALAAEATEVGDRQAADIILQGNIDTIETDYIAGDAATLASANSYTDSGVAALVNSAPAVLNTLNELALALGSDPDFATTVSGNIGAIDTRVTAAEGNITTLQTSVATKAATSSLATVATSGSYTDLADKPSIPSISGLASETYVDTAVSTKANTSSLATVATSGSYTDLTNKPTIPTDLDSLTDVTITTPAANQIIKYNGTAWVNSDAAAAGATTLDELTDVVITTPLKGHMVVHDGTNFVNSNTIQTSGASIKALIVKGAALQTANVFEIQNSSSVVGLSVNSNQSAMSMIATTGSSASFRTEANYAWTQMGRAYLQFGSYTGGYIGSGDDGIQFTVRMGAALDAEAIRVDGKTAGSTLAPRVGIGEKTITAGAQLNVTTVEAARKGLIVKGAASQSANLLEVQNNAATALVSVSSAGTLHAPRYTETVANAFSTTLTPSTGTLTVDTSTGSAVLGTLAAAVTTWAFTNVPTENSKVTSVTVVLVGNASYTYGDACSVNGVAVTNGIMWSGGGVPAATAGYDIIAFLIVKDSSGTILVFGSATTNFI